MIGLDRESTSAQNMVKNPKRSIDVAIVAATLLLVTAGCSGGEFRAEVLPSKAEIQKQIDQVTDNPKIPEAAKPGIIKGLQEKMKRAQ
jgi:hypothetical protein